MAEARGEMAATGDSGSLMGSALHGALIAGSAAALAIGAAGAASAKAAIDYQSLTTTIVTGAGESVSNLDLIRQGVLDLAGQVGSAPDELAKGLYNIESAGYHGAAGLDVLKVAAEGAKVGNADMATVADAVTSALNAYHLPASQAAQVTNDLIATVAQGKMHMQDLADSLGKILPVASALHVPLGQVSGAIATMTMQGTDASQATTALRFLMSALAGPTSAAAKEMEALGVGEKEIPGITKAASQALQDMGLHTSDVAAALADPNKGLTGALAMVTDAISKKFPVGSAEYEAALKAAVGGTRGMTAALELTGQNMSTFQGNIQAISGAVNSSGDTIKGWGLVQEDTQQKFDEAWGAIQATAIQVGSVALQPLASAFQGIADGASAASGFVHAVIDDLNGVAAPGEHAHSRLADINTDMTSNAPMEWAQRIRTIGDWFETYVIPPAERFSSWVTGTAVPALEQFAGFVEENILPMWVNIGHALVDVGTFVKDNVIPPFISFVRDVGTPLVGVMKFLSEHLTIVEVGLGLIAARFVAIKAAGAAQEIVKFADGFMTLAQGEGKIRALIAAIGLGGDQGLVGGVHRLGAEWDALGQTMMRGKTFQEGSAAAQALADALRGGTTGAIKETKDAIGLLAEKMGVSRKEAELSAPELKGLSSAVGGVARDAAAAGGAVGEGGLLGAIGGISGTAIAATAGIALLAGGIAALATDTGGLRTTIKNAIWGEDQQQAINEARAQFKDLGAEIGEAFVRGGDAAKKAMDQTIGVVNDQFGKTNPMLATSGVLSQLLGDKLKDVQKGGQQAADTLWEMGAKGGTAFAVLNDAGDTTARNLADDLAKAAQNGEQSWASAESDIKKLWDDARAHHSAMTAALAGDYAFAAAAAESAQNTITGNAIASANQQVMANATARDQAKQDFVDEATSVAKSKHLEGKAATDFINQYVTDHVGMFDKIHPEWAQSSQEVDDYAKRLGHTRQYILDIGIAAAQEEVDAQSYWNDQITTLTTLNGKLLEIGSNIGSINGKLANTYGGAGGRTTFGEGGKVGQPTDATVGERGEFEWIIPQHKAPAWLQGAMDLALAGRAPSMPPGMGGIGSGGTLSASVPPGGGGPALVYQPRYGDIVVQGGGGGQDVGTQIRRALDDHDRELVQMLRSAGIAA
jgi:TP901 family phage tail tape measure protein